MLGPGGDGAVTNGLAAAAERAVDVLRASNRPGSQLIGRGEFERPAALLRELDELFLHHGSLFNAIRGDQNSKPSNSAEAAKLFRDGWSLQLENSERFLSESASLCALVRDRLLATTTRANIYMSPSGSSPGFDVHHDTSDVLVFQLQGSKTWNVWEQTLRDPLWRMPASLQSANAPGRHLLELTLNEGDVLFVRRGDPHVAVAQGSNSVHLTFGLHRLTATDVALTAIERLATHPRLRASMPWDTVEDTDPVVNWIEETLRVTAECLREFDPGAMLEMVRETRTRNLALSSISLGSILEDKVSAKTPVSAHPLLAITRFGPSRIVAGGVDLEGDSAAVRLAEELLLSARHGAVTLEDFASRCEATWERVLPVATHLISLGLLQVRL